MPTRKQINATIELLCARFPACFVMLQYRRRPIKVGINADLVAALGEEVDRRLIGAALRDYTRNLHYRLSQKPGVARIDLDGAAADVTSIKAALAAKKQQSFRKQVTPPGAAAATAVEPAIAPPEPPKQPLSLAGLKAAAQRRKAAAMA